MDIASKLKIGFIGAGANSRLRHLPEFARIPGVELAVVANRSMGSSERVAAEFGIRRVAPSWREIVADPEIEAVCIGTWPDSHAEITCAALAAGKHVLVEARMARTLGEAETMMKAAQNRPELVAQIVPSPITLRVDEEVRQMIERGALGEIREVGVEHATGVNADASSRLTWRQDERISGVNTMALGICFEPLMRWIEGDVSVQAVAAQVFTRERVDAWGESRKVVIPDSLTVMGQWANGARLIMHHTSIEIGANRCAFRIVGAKATLVFDAVSSTLSIITGEGESCPIALDRPPECAWQVEAQFVDSIRCGTPVRLTNFESGLRYMQFTQAVWDTWSRPRA